MSDDYKPEDEAEAEAFNVKTASPEEIEAHIGDLQVEIQRLHALLDEIVAIAHR